MKLDDSSSGGIMRHFKLKGSAAHTRMSLDVLGLNPFSIVTNDIFRQHITDELISINSFKEFTNSDEKILMEESFETAVVLLQ